MQALSEKIATTPIEAGVYIMYDENKNVIYIGKAKNIRKRLSSYFYKSSKDIKTKVLTDKIRDIETIITKTEQEAFILESILIKKHRPRYNIVLKDDKSYLSLKINLEEKYPRISLVRRIEDTPKKNKALYFGPFASSSSIRQTLNIINRIFKLRKCKSKFFFKRERPCLNYQIGRCLAPCCFNVDKKEYDTIIKEVSLFLKGRKKELVNAIKNNIKIASEKQNYEFAATLRDKLFALKKTLEKQFIVNTDFIDRDIIAIATESTYVSIAILFVRGGFLNGNKYFNFKNIIEDKKEILFSFIKQYYEKGVFLPKEVLIDEKIEDKKWFIKIVGFKNKINILNPIRGEKKQILKIAKENAKKELKNFIKSDFKNIKILTSLQNSLKIKNLPKIIECFDNSHISGQSPVSAMVVFKDGKKHKKSYRKYILKTKLQSNDYAYMKEALERRYKNTDNFPDILLIDGGKGQLSALRAVLKELNLEGKIKSLIGIAKKDKKKGETKDKIYKLNRSNQIKINDESLLFLQKIRDEAHRFVISFHRLKRKKKAFTSFFDTIENLGQKRKKLLLNHFKSISKIKEASIDDLRKVNGIGEKTAKQISGGI